MNILAREVAGAMTSDLVQKNPISRLQEICQVWKLPLPKYKECEGSYQEFGTEVSTHLDTSEEPVMFKALGRTKKTSKANVAQKALDYIREHRPALLEAPPIVEV